MRARRELVLLPARDAGLCRRMLAMAAHVHATARAPQPVLDHAVDHLLVAELHAIAHAIHIERRVRHRLHSTGDDDFRVPRLDRLRGKHHGLEARAAHLVDGDRAHRGRDTGLEHCLPRRRLPDAALQHVAHDDFVHRCAVDAGALQCFTNGHRAELRRREAREGAEELADRRARGRDDDRRAGFICHGDLVEFQPARIAAGRPETYPRGQTRSTAPTTATGGGTRSPVHRARRPPRHRR